MSLEEAHLILNVKKDDNMETILSVSVGSEGYWKQMVAEGTRQSEQSQSSRGHWLFKGIKDGVALDCVLVLHA